MKLILILLLVPLIASAGEEALSTQDATAIVKTRIGNDGLSDKKFTLRLIPASKSHEAIYMVKFDPAIPDNTIKDKAGFIGYIVDMKGGIKRVTFLTTISYVAPEKRSDYSASAPRIVAERFRKNPFDDPITLGLKNSR